MWKRYCEASGTPEDHPHDTWAFSGGGPVGDRLAGLVLSGLKTATASWHECCLIENAVEEIPHEGTLSVILYSSGEAACVIKDTFTDIVPFSEVDDLHAYLEGEGDRGLEYWREVHRAVFAAGCAEDGIEFTEDGKVVLERFVVVYR